jgi:hypothetical protein
MYMWISVGFIFFIGCAGTKEAIQEEQPKQDINQYDESFNPLTLNDDDITIVGAENTPLNDNLSDNSEGDKLTTLKEITGFRVQILATKNIETASLFEQEASERFKNLDQKTYLIFETPLYKIRVGDCKERSQAEELRDLAIQYGYREAFIVKTKIQVME